MEIAVLSVPNGLPKWNLVTAFLRMRRAVFIEQLRWDLQSAQLMEFEQYDRVDTVYVIAHENGQIRGGARLLRTDRRVGIYSYMIRDAFNDLLPTLPREICRTEPPSDQGVWELTRLTTDGTAGVGPQLLHAVNRFLLDEGAEACLFLGSPAFMRMARSLSYVPTALGPISGNRDGRFLAFSCAVRP